MAATARSHLEPCSRGVIDAEPCPEELGRAGPIRQRRLILTACILASSMAFIDGSALTVALPALRDDLGASLSTVQWVISAYILSLAAFVLIGGALADVYGKARMLTIGCVAFGVASAICALAETPLILIGARFLQGAAAAIVAPASLALIGATYPKKDRGKAIGVWASASALTTAAGPVLGGWLTEIYGWPAIFWLNPPLAAAAIGLLVLAKAEDAPDPRRFDIPGAAILAASLGGLAWGLSAIGPGEAEELAGEAVSRRLSISIETILAIGAGALLMGAYAWWERRSDHPMTPPRLFANRTLTGLNLATLMIYTGLSIMFFLLPFELIDGRGLSPTTTGLAFLPFTLSVGFLSAPLGGFADRFGVRPMLAGGSIIAALGYGMLIILRPAGFPVGVLLPMAVLGVAFAAMVGPLTAAVMSSVEDKDEGLASGMSNAASRIAQLLGVALAAGLASLASGYLVALSVAVAASIAGAAIIMKVVPGD